MEEDYVSFETAKKLKEKGFNACCNALYCNTFSEKNKYEFVFYYYPENWNKYQNITNLISAPTLYVAQKWLALEKKIYVEVTACCDFQFQVYLKTLEDKDHNIISSASQYNSIKEALEAGIKKTLELI